jgi:hypothetical protein
MGSALAAAAAGFEVIVATLPAGAQEAVPAPIDQSLDNFDWSVWRLERQHHALELDLGPIYWRRVGSTSRSLISGFEAGAGSATMVRIKPLVLSSLSEIVFREFDSESYALSYMQHVSAGLALGPFEPEVSVALSLVTVDAFHGNWSGELFVPRTAAGAWMHLGALRLGAHAFGEYLWRWLGNGDVVLRGIAFSLELGR